MKTKQMIIGAALTLCGVFTAPTLRAQESASAERVAADSRVPIKVLVTLTEYDGSTKISSLPYAIPVVVRSPTGFATVRVGARVPVKTENAKDGQEGINYIDIGTNIDVSAETMKDGRYAVKITVDRSSLYVPYRDKDGAPQTKDWTAGDLPTNNLQPMLRQFRAIVDYVLRDGQPSEQSSTTDPLSGHVLKIDAVVTALK